MNFTKHTILTHAGAFHADELMAIALLEKFHLAQPVTVPKELSGVQVKKIASGQADAPPSGEWLSGGIEDLRTPCAVMRSRDPQTLQLARNCPHTFVIDVGGELNPEMLNFDHHQKSMTEAWPDNTPLSSTGLIWLWLKKKGALNELSPALIEEMEEALIRPLDAHDNGVARCKEAEVIDAFNRSSVDPEGQLRQFELALNFARQTLDNFQYVAALKAEAREVLEAAWQNAKRRGEKHVVLSEPLAYRDGTRILKEISAGEAQILAVPGSGGRYSLISTPLEEDFSISCPIPEEWRGKMDLKVQAGDRLVSLVFGHKSGFMCVIEGQVGDAHAAARHIVSSHFLPRVRPGR